jgi:hypothetical protein
MMRLDHERAQLIAPETSLRRESIELLFACFAIGEVGDRLEIVGDEELNRIYGHFLGRLARLRLDHGIEQ